MAVMLGALIIVGAVAVLNLVFTFGVVRRLRLHTEELARLAAGGMGAAAEPPILPPGTRIGDFQATATDGTSVSRSGLDGPTMIGFFSPHCGPCRESLPRFAAEAGRWPGGRSRLLAVVAGTAEDASGFADQLAPAAQVVVEAEDGPVASAFAVRGFPAYAAVDRDGTVVASGYSIDALMADLPV